MGYVAGVAGVILDGASAVTDFMKGGTWNDIEGVYQLANAAASTYVIGQGIMKTITQTETETEMIGTISETVGNVGQLFAGLGEFAVSALSFDSAGMSAGLSTMYTAGLTIGADLIDAGGIGVLIMVGVLLAGFLIKLFKPKPLTGPQLVAKALYDLHAQYDGVDVCENQNNGCFPAAALVSVNNSTLPMSQLQLGMPVTTIAHDGTMQSTPVHFFGHKDHDSLAVFHHIVTESGKNVSLTGDHFLPVAKASNTPWSARTFKRARSVQEGDYLWVKGLSGKLELSMVTGLRSFVSTGLFNPYSANGATLVDNVVTSDHSQWILDDFFSDDNAHMLPFLYAPFLQTALAAVYSIAPTLVESVSECWYVSDAPMRTWADASCTIRSVGAWLLPLK